MEKSALTPISIIILTYNEAQNIEDCIKSIGEWADKIFIVDSYSSDQTMLIAKKLGINFVQNHWVSFAEQRKWSINNLELTNDWILFLDADERLTIEVKQEITSLLTQELLRENGFYIRRRFFFLDKWLRHGGYYPSPEIRLMKRQQVQFIDEGGGARERFIVNGLVGHLQKDIFHLYNKGITEWIMKHLKLAQLEAEADLLTKNQANRVDLIGSIGSTNWLRVNIWNKLPRTIRPFLLFIYRYFLKFGFLDGKQGLYYCFLHDFWFPFLIDIFYFEKVNNLSLLGKTEKLKPD
ncbi:MAG: glycosyl transferase family 2 [Chloroflexi bacterium HGW-Chloroflexi-8]|nr:MAG: glycosyl transferase family 2 [Chloroflexi bacterium HGW-Chloroflexi-8]